MSETDPERPQRGPLVRLGVRAADALIAPAFGRPGYRLRERTWDPAALEVDLAGRTYLVTGANSGIGYATALGLARRGGTVHMLCRNRERGEAARAAITEASDNGAVHLHLLDLSRMAEVRDFARAWGPRPIDGLVHCAGDVAESRTETPEGVELTFAVHVAGPHALTRGLRAGLCAERGHVVFVSSGGMYAVPLRPDDLQNARRYDGVRAYGHAKRAQVHLARLWSEQLESCGVRVNAMHPGWVDTPLLQRGLPIFRRVTRAILRSPEEGADTILWLLIAREAMGRTAEFFLDREARSIYAPWDRHRPDLADLDALWAECERTADL